MNYMRIEKDSMVNGTGVRVVLWVSGCEHNCRGCHNPHTHDTTAGVKFDEEAEKELFDILAQPYIQGITFSGGDPLHANNYLTVFEISKKIKNKFPNKDVWVYTGYCFEEVLKLPTGVLTPTQNELLKYIDVLVDGKFVLEQKDTSLHYRGSKNQNIIDVKQSIKQNKKILLNI